MNIYDIAREAGVSISTVSRVLNNKTNVTPATRARIQAVLDKHNYSPSAIARGLVAKSMKTVAILTVDLRVPHYARTAYVVERAFRKLGYNVLVCNTGGELEETRHYAQMLTERQADGVILVGSVFNELGRDPQVSAALQGMPIVIANGALDLPNSYSVLVDDRLGASLALNHLLEKGHREIAYVKDLETGSAKAKLEGFLEAARRAGLPAPAARVLTTEYGIEGGQEAAAQLLALGKRPTAVICAEDLTAVGVMKGLAKAGLQVPGDVAVTGYNNSEYSRICTPELTTVDNKGDMSARFAVQLLESRINGDDSFSSMTIQPELVVRQST